MWCQPTRERGSGARAIRIALPPSAGMTQIPPVPRNAISCPSGDQAGYASATWRVSRRRTRPSVSITSSPVTPPTTSCCPSGAQEKLVEAEIFFRPEPSGRTT